jgi:hypothetical protein
LLKIIDIILINDRLINEGEKKLPLAVLLALSILSFLLCSKGYVILSAKNSGLKGEFKWLMNMCYLRMREGLG